MGVGGCGGENDECAAWMHTYIHTRGFSFLSADVGFGGGGSSTQEREKHSCWCWFWRRWQQHTGEEREKDKTKQSTTAIAHLIPPRGAAAATTTPRAAAATLHHHLHPFPPLPAAAPKRARPEEHVVASHWRALLPLLRRAHAITTITATAIGVGAAAALAALALFPVDVVLGRFFWGGGLRFHVPSHTKREYYN